MKLVKSRLRRWRVGDIQELWSNVLIEEEKLPRQWKRTTRPLKRRYREPMPDEPKVPLRRDSIERPSRPCAQKISLPPSSAALDEMLAKHPQVSPPKIPLDPAPFPADISEGDVLRGF